MVRGAVQLIRAVKDLVMWTSVVWTLRIIGRFDEQILILKGRIRCQREWQGNTLELGDRSSRNTGLTDASGELLPNFPTIFYIRLTFTDRLTEYLGPPTGRDIGPCVHLLL